MIVPIILLFLTQKIVIGDTAVNEDSAQLTPIPETIKKQFEDVPTVRDCDLINETYEYLKALIRRYVPKKFQYLGCIDMFFRTTNLKCANEKKEHDARPLCEELRKQYNCSLKAAAIPSMDKCNETWDFYNAIAETTVPDYKNEMVAEMNRNDVDEEEECVKIHYFNALPESTRTVHHYAYIYDKVLKYMVPTFASKMLHSYGQDCIRDLNKKALAFFGLTSLDE